MVNFDLRMFNFPAEKLIKPRQRLQPIQVPEYVKKALTFQEDVLENLNEESDVVVFIDYFSFEVGFDNLKDIEEYISNHEFFEITESVHNKEAIKKIITAYFFTDNNKSI